jgi:hypothetical protein
LETKYRDSYTCALLPISVLSVVSKIVIFRQFTMHLNSREFINQKQSGFRVVHSCTTALLEITEDVRTTAKVRDQYFAADGFDSVTHDLLLLKIVGADTLSNVLG